MDTYNPPVDADPRDASGATELNSASGVPSSRRYPVTKLPAGFDISRYGRHAQAAFLGPTPDNPSLSLIRRLKRAAFFDQRERRAAEAAARQTGTDRPE